MALDYNEHATHATNVLENMADLPSSLISLSSSEDTRDHKDLLGPEFLTYRAMPRNRRIRRLVDSTCALISLIFLAPVVFAASLAVYIEDGRPVLFSQKRVGRFGIPFTMYKLRTMKHNVGDAMSPRHEADERITRVGRILRKTSIDELPQLFNILRGDMAIIGPRPEMPIIVANYQKWQHLRHLITPGLTGLWQTTARKTISMEKPEATMLDLRYIETMSLSVDIRLVFRTAVCLFRQKGAF